MKTKSNELALNGLQHLFMVLVFGTTLYTFVQEILVKQGIEVQTPWRLLGFCLTPLSLWFKWNNDNRAIDKIISNKRRGKEELITEGWYRFSRNPCYLGMAGGVLGFLLIAPSWFGAVSFLGMLIAANLTIFAEERRLQDLFGQKYTLYKQTVGRWVSTPAQLSALFHSR